MANYAMKPWNNCSLNIYPPHSHPQFGKLYGHLRQCWQCYVSSTIWYLSCLIFGPHLIYIPYKSNYHLTKFDIHIIACYCVGGAGIAGQRIPGTLNPEQQPCKCSSLAVLENQRIVSVFPFPFPLCTRLQEFKLVSLIWLSSVIHCPHTGHSQKPANSECFLVFFLFPCAQCF